MSETRTPPWSEEAERGALGAMLLDPLRLIDMARSRMRIGPESFFLPAHQMICEGMFELTGQGKPVDSLTLTQHLRDKELLDRIGGSAALDKLIDGCPTAEHGEHYLDIVRQKAILRKEIYLCKEIEEEARRAERGDEHVATVPGRFIEIIGEVTEEVSNSKLMARSFDRWRKGNRLLAKFENRQPEWAMGLKTPWPNLTEVLCGLENGITILAARPSEGKTTVESEISVQLAAMGIPVGRVSMDMTAERLLQRSACRMAGVSLPKLKSGWADGGDLKKVEDAQNEIAKYPLYINDWDRDIDSICSWIRAEKVKHGIQLVTLDFMTCITYWAAKGNWNANMVISHISGELKRLANRLPIPILLLSQLSRSPDKDQRVPKLSDLRDSGALEQDASKVIFVYRDMTIWKAMEGRKEGSTKPIRATWIDVAKNQDGECGRVPFWFHAPYFLFEECDGFEGWESKIGEEKTQPRGGETGDERKAPTRSEAQEDFEGLEANED